MTAERAHTAGPRGRRPAARTSAAAAIAVAGAVAVAAVSLVAALDVGAAAGAAAPPPGCTRDVECKGARICVKGACVDPPPLAPVDGGARDLAPPREALARMAGAPPPGASPMFHGGPTHAGRSPYRAPLAAPKRLARVTTGGVVYGAPAVAIDGTAWFGSHDHAVRAAARDGAVRWTRKTDDLVWAAPALSPDSATVYVGSDDDHLYALDARDGAVRWSYLAGPCTHAIGVGPQTSRCDVDGVTVAPDGTVYFVADGVYALSPRGELLFRVQLSTHCAGAPALGADATVYVGCQDGALYAFAWDGSKRWDFRAGDDVDSSPAVGADGTIYVGSDDGKLYAIAPSGAPRWAVQTGGPVRSSPALGEGGMIYVGSFDGGLYAVRPSGAVAWVFHAADRIVSSPVVDASGAVLVGSEDDRLYAVERDGRLRWSVLLGGDVDGTPVIGADGTIYVGADDKALHLLR